MTKKDLDFIANNRPMTQFDMVVTNSLSSNVTVEIGNGDNSSILVYDANAQTTARKFHPVCGVPSNISGAIVVQDPTTPNGYFLLLMEAGVDAFVNAANPVPPAGFNSLSYVYFDESGALCYKEGFVNGVQDAGICTLQSTQTNYRHVYEVFKKEAFLLDRIIFKVKSGFESQLNESVTIVQSNIVSNSNTQPINPSAFETERALNPLIITVPIQKLITPKAGLRFNMQPGSVGTPNIVNMSIFFKAASSKMLDLM